MRERIGRNDPCPCGSGKKYKKCCLNKQRPQFSQEEIENIFKLVKEKERPEPNLDIVPSIEWKNFRWRVIWNTVYSRPLQETFNEFTLFILKKTFGDGWYKGQMELPPNERHIILKWIGSYADWKTTHITDENKISGKDMWEARPSGDVQALFSLAYDLYCLQIVNTLPNFLLRRLKDRQVFQSARYEIAVAAIMARGGFEIQFLDKTIKSEKHCEFIAKHKRTGVEIGVEAKSRRRKGVLHESGEFTPEDSLKADIKFLFQDACLQKPQDLPFIIFIDLNMPSTTDWPYEERPEVKDIKAMFDLYDQPSEANPDPYNALILTNFSFYYEGINAQASKRDYVVIIPLYPATAISNQTCMGDLWSSLERYIHIPKEV